MATAGYDVEMLNSVNILLLDIVCQLEELCQMDMDPAHRQQVSWIRKMSDFIQNPETKEMVQKKISSILHWNQKNYTDRGQMLWIQFKDF